MENVFSVRPTGKFPEKVELPGLPSKQFHFFWEFSSRANRKNVFHLAPNRNFRNFWLNGKRPRRNTFLIFPKVCCSTFICLLTSAANVLCETSSSSSDAGKIIIFIRCSACYFGPRGFSWFFFSRSGEYWRVAKQRQTTNSPSPPLPYPQT